MKSFSEMLQVLRDLKSGEGTAYIAYDVPLKVCINFWVELDREGKVSHFSPHINFYTGETENDSVVAVLNSDDYGVATKQDMIDYLREFAIQSGLDEKAQVWERDEDADI